VAQGLPPKKFGRELGNRSVDYLLPSGFKAESGFIGGAPDLPQIQWFFANCPIPERKGPDRNGQGLFGKE
jgi:hypothetical protein